MSLSVPSGSRALPQGGKTPLPIYLALTDRDVGANDGFGVDRCDRNTLRAHDR